MAYNSTIKAKKCKTEGCRNWPYLGMAGKCLDHASPELLAKKRSKAKDAAKRAQTNVISRNLHKQQLANTEAGKKETGAKIALKRAKNKENPKNDTHSVLLQLADKLVSRNVKVFFSDNDGNYICPCCGKSGNINDKDSENQPITQTLHYIDRGNMKHRFRIQNQRPGHRWCNKQMFDEGMDGAAAQAYRKVLVEAYGEEFVMAMELSKRSVNRMSNAEIQEIISLYTKNK